MTWELARILETEVAAELVAAWGFPRAIDPTEVEAADWFRLGTRVVWWYEAEHEEMPGVRFIHLAVAPQARRRWPVRWWHQAAQEVALVLGASQLVVADFEESGHVAGYLRRMGWTPSGPFMVKPLGGVSVGQTVKNMFNSATMLFTKPKKFFTKDGILNSPFIDPGQFIFTPREKQPGKPVDQEQVAADAKAREAERRRIASGSSSTYSRKNDALSASIGKRFLGGAS